MLAATTLRIAIVLNLGLVATGGAQELDLLTSAPDLPTPAPGERGEPPGLVPEPTSEALDGEPLGPVPDSLDEALEVEILAATDQEERLIVSLEDRLLVWMKGSDTLRVAPVAVGKGTRLEHGDTAWEFSTPRGVRRLLSKQANPVWTPPDWHYVELARDSGLVLVTLPRDSAVELADGSRVVVRSDRIGRILPDGRFELVPADEEVIFGDTLFIPPHGTANRQVEGELGDYKLDLGDGYMIHGTPHKTSIGTAATHGCIRMRDGDLEQLYYRVPVGTPVYIY